MRACTREERERERWGSAARVCVCTWDLPFISCVRRVPSLLPLSPPSPPPPLHLPPCHLSPHFTDILLPAAPASLTAPAVPLAHYLHGLHRSCPRARLQDKRKAVAAASPGAGSLRRDENGAPLVYQRSAY